jgi:hypothetical protein
MAPAQGWHAQIEKWSKFFAILRTGPWARPKYLLIDPRVIVFPYGHAPGVFLLGPSASSLLQPDMRCSVELTGWSLARGSTHFWQIRPQATFFFWNNTPKQLFMACYLAIVPLSIPTCPVPLSTFKYHLFSHNEVSGGADPYIFVMLRFSSIISTQSPLLLQYLFSNKPQKIMYKSGINFSM